MNKKIGVICLQLIIQTDGTVKGKKLNISGFDSPYSRQNLSLSDKGAVYVTVT